VVLFVTASVGVFLPGVWAQSASDKAKLEAVRQISQRFSGKYPGAVEISPAEAMAILEKGEVLFVDVRGAAEMAVSMLPGAVTRGAYEKDPGIPQGKTVVAYCTIGARSGSYSQKMNRQGARVLSLSGGVLAWLLEGGKVYHDGVETKRVHVFGNAWNYLPEGYEAATGGR
jgi:sodium/bile acid cotransporter 7